MQFLGKERFQLNETKKEINSAANRLMKISYNFYDIINRKKYIKMTHTDLKCVNVLNFRTERDSKS